MTKRKAMQMIIVCRTNRMRASPYICFSDGKWPKDPCKMCTIKFEANFSFSRFTSSPPKDKASICVKELWVISNFRKFVKFIKSFGSIEAIWFLLKSLVKEKLLKTTDQPHSSCDHLQLNNIMPNVGKIYFLKISQFGQGASAAFHLQATGILGNWTTSTFFRTSGI